MYLYINLIRFYCFRGEKKYCLEFVGDIKDFLFYLWFLIIFLFVLIKFIVFFKLFFFLFYFLFRILVVIVGIVK